MNAMALPAPDERLSMRYPNFPRASVVALLMSASLAIPAQADKIKNPTAIFAGLDKITGRIISFEAAIDETIQFGSLQITTRVCYSRPETDNPQTTTFIEVDEVGSDNQYKKIFAGWMFASSPGLNAIEHPVYDVWLTECKGGKEIIKTPPEQDDMDEPPLSAEAKKQPKPVLDAARKQNAATNAPLRLPDATGLGVPVPPSAVAPRAQPRQSFFPTNSSPARGGAGYDPGPKN